MTNTIHVATKKESPEDHYSFNGIRLIACEHVYSWDNGEDFYWLQQQWNSLQSSLKSRAEAEAFILCLNELYTLWRYDSFFSQHHKNDFSGAGLRFDNLQYYEVAGSLGDIGNTSSPDYSGSIQIHGYKLSKVWNNLGVYQKHNFINYPNGSGAQPILEEFPDCFYSAFEGPVIFIYPDSSIIHLKPK